MKSKLTNILFIALPIVTGLLVILEIISINQYASSGKDLQTINSHISDLTQQNTILEEKIASYSSLVAIAKRANELGFIQPSSTQYQTLISDQIPVALKTPQ